MKISVIIPVKNRAALLPYTLDNILSQFLQPWEIIVVNDDSTDNIYKVIKKYNSSVIFTKCKGKGPGAARNTGLRIATGNAIQFFDSDDIMTKNKLQVQNEILMQQQVDFVYGPSVKAISINGTWKQRDVIMQYHPLPKDSLTNFVLKGWCAITQSVLFSKALINEVGFWREDLMPHEDYEYWFRIGKIAKKFQHENQTCVIYRQHEQQITDKLVSTQARWLDGILAMQYISDGINFKPSLNSLLSFKGQYAFSKKVYFKKFGKQSEIKVNFLDYLYMFYYRIRCKLGRTITGTAWQQMHGVLANGNREFENYVRSLL